jgi:hypothetical protein
MPDIKADEAVVKRISKDISMFHESVKTVETKRPFGKKAQDVVELSKMYASDAQSYLDRGDLYTSFSCISYAHGLLDAVIKML